MSAAANMEKEMELRYIDFNFCICYNASRRNDETKFIGNTAKSPGGANSGAFLFRFGEVAYSPGWLPATIFYPAICKCSRRLHLPE